MDNIMYIKGVEYLGLPFPLDVKGGECLGGIVLFPSSPKGEIVGIMIQVLSSMETHSNDSSQRNKLFTDQTLEIEERECFKKYTMVHFFQAAYTRRLTKQKESIRIHALPQEEKHVHVGKPRFWSKVLV